MILIGPAMVQHVAVMTPVWLSIGQRVADTMVTAAVPVPHVYSGCTGTKADPEGADPEVSIMRDWKSCETKRIVAVKPICALCLLMRTSACILCYMLGVDRKRAV